MHGDNIRDCRERVRSALGGDAASKASDAFCVEFADPSTATFAAASALPGTGLVVLELVPEPQPSIPLSDAVESLRGTKIWNDVPGATLSALRDAFDPRSAPRANALLNPTALLREVYIKEMRDRCYRAAGPIRNELDRTAAGFLALIPERAGSLTQYCWLNQTILTWIDPRGLASLAGDPRIARIDLPQPLELEVAVTGQIVGAIQYRQRTGHSGKGVIAAVLDTEVDQSHPAFEDRVINKRNFTQEGWGNPRRHGTAVAAIIAAKHEVHAGMAPDALIYSYKLFPPGARSDDFHAACALQQALEDGAHIANCSWGTSAATDGTSRLVRAFDTAWDLGMAIVKSAGNKGDAPGSVTSPADARGVIVVGATDRRGMAVQGYSGRGPTLNGKVCPDLVAPGGNKSEEIITCVPGRGFGEAGDGTSVAAAHVSGLLCLGLQEDPGRTPGEQRDWLLTFCKKLPEGDENVQGKGLVSLA